MLNAETARKIASSCSTETEKLEEILQCLL